MKNYKVPIFIAILLFPLISSAQVVSQRATIISKIQVIEQEIVLLESELQTMQAPVVTPITPAVTSIIVNGVTATSSITQAVCNNQNITEHVVVNFNTSVVGNSITANFSKADGSLFTRTYNDTYSGPEFTYDIPLNVWNDNMDGGNSLVDAGQNINISFTPEAGCN